MAGRPVTSQSLPSSAVIVRAATPADAERLAELAGQLGYPSAADDLARRLAQLQQAGGHSVYVAELGDGTVAGWVHVHLHRDLLGEPQAEIGGLVVDELCRGRRIGRRLMERVEQWAREHGCAGVYLRSNVIRRDAHRFYEQFGFRTVKTQLALAKRF
jgi:GNAT superfamily N-acetyltransferase